MVREINDTVERKRERQREEKSEKRRREIWRILMEYNRQEKD